MEVKDRGLVKVFQQDGQIMTDSLNVAEVFGKEHYNVIRDIENLNVPDDFRSLNFEGSNYTTSQGKQQPMYRMTRDGFTLLVMGFTGKKAMKFKMAYIEAFNRMEQAMSSSPVSVEHISRAIISIENMCVELRESNREMKAANEAAREQNQVQYSRLYDEFGGVSGRVNVIESKVDGIETKLAEVLDLNKRRRKVSKSDQKTHDHHLYRAYNGLCPCCKETLILDECCRPIVGQYEMDHFYSREKNGIDQTWPICKSCNNGRSNGRLDNTRCERLFNGYQASLEMFREKESRQQVALFGGK